MNKVYCMDAFDFLNQIEDESIDLIIIDPPYNVAQKREFSREGSSNISLDFGEWDYFGTTQEGDEKYLDFIKNLIRLFHKKIKFDGNIVIFMVDRYTSYIRHFVRYDMGYHFKATITWIKTNPPPRFLKKSFISACETCIVFSRIKDSKFNFLNMDEMKNYYVSNLVMGKERTKHPTQKPLKLIKRLIKILSDEGDLVMDCFIGSGTTAVGAQQLNRNYIGCDNIKEYVDITNQRLSQRGINDF